ncbi:MAG: hypothetical protein GY859_01380 [Desulfobacterales bacterium]|nr:hypothetical protein [Desulfobacterales bacterium]
MKERAGLGKPGEVHLVGADKRMRSDSFLDPVNHSVKASFAEYTEMYGYHDLFLVNEELSSQAEQLQGAMEFFKKGGFENVGIIQQTGVAGKKRRIAYPHGRIGKATGRNPGAGQSEGIDFRSHCRAHVHGGQGFIDYIHQRRRLESHGMHP